SRTSLRCGPLSFPASSTTVQPSPAHALARRMATRSLPPSAKSCSITQNAGAAAGSGRPAIPPQAEDRQRIQQATVVAFAGAVFGKYRVHCGRRQESRAAQPAVIPQLPREVAEIPGEPFGEGNRKTLLAPAGCSLGQPGFDCLAKQVLA